MEDVNNIWIAASDGDMGAVIEFIRNGLTANSKDEAGYTPVHAAAAYGHIDLLRYLVQICEGDVNITDNDGDTPLHHTDTVETAELLISLGADMNKANNAGLTPPYIGLIEYNDEMVDYYKSIGFVYVLTNAEDDEEEENPLNVSHDTHKE